jgi:hypothetical protein
LMCIWYLCDLQQCKDIPVIDIFNMATNTISYSTSFSSSSLFWLSIFGLTFSHESFNQVESFYSPILHGEDLHNQNLRFSFIIFPGHKCPELPLLFIWWSGTSLEPKSLMLYHHWLSFQCGPFPAHTSNFLSHHCSILCLMVLFRQTLLQLFSKTLLKGRLTHFLLINELCSW